MPVDLSKLPPADKNNLWYDYRPESDTVLIFVHGVLSDSRSTWLHGNEKNPEEATYWPELLSSDSRIKGVSTYLAGYYSEPNSYTYSIQNCADELFQALSRKGSEGRNGPLAKQKIVFICHSMGGIVVRYMLERRLKYFIDKSIGLLLIASPSYGSADANLLDVLIRFYNMDQGKQLQFGNFNLVDLDSRFKELIENRSLPSFLGWEAAETHFILSPKKGWWHSLRRKPIVPPESANRYFATFRKIPATDHFSVVRPDSLNHLSHELLIDFLENFRKLEPPPKPDFA